MKDEIGTGFSVPVIDGPQPDAMHYHIHSTAPTAVEAWSTRRLPFEPRGWQLEFRRELRAAVQELTAPPDACLHAIYTSLEDGHWDVENVLFFNVGPAAFARAMAHGVRFERAIGEVPPPTSLAGDGIPYAHHGRYAVAPAAESWAVWQANVTLGTWDISLKPTDLTYCAAVWRAMKQGQIRPLARRASDAEPFGLRLWLNVPDGVTLRLHTLLKPLLDGMIAALHHFEGTPAPDVCRYLAARLRVDADEICRWLTDSASGVLGPRSGLVRPFRTGVQWHPQDDRCAAADIRITQRQGPLSLHGEIMTLKLAAATVRLDDEGTQR